MFLLLCTDFKASKRKNWKYKISPMIKRKIKTLCMLVVPCHLKTRKPSAYTFPFSHCCQVINLPMAQFCLCQAQLQTICCFPLSPEQNPDSLA